MAEGWGDKEGTGEGMWLVECEGREREEMIKERDDREGMWLAMREEKGWKDEETTKERDDREEKKMKGCS